MTKITNHKYDNGRNPTVSIILLDWSCRESFHSLDWLMKQNVPRKDYEIIWVELYDRVIPDAMKKADVVITCGQKGMYHKHVGYNAGLLHAKGQVICVCDSDAVFSPDFISSIINAFNLPSPEPSSLVLMHYEWRTKHTYPAEKFAIEDLSNYEWSDLWPNVGACMSVLRADAVRFGGFDEHSSYRGYLCGPYDLGWRLVNAGIAEIWHDPSVALWHFAHPDPAASFGQSFSFKLWREKAYPHIEHHALTAVEAFSSGRLLPLRENPEVHQLRMSLRRVGTKYEERFATMTHLAGFSRWRLFKSYASLMMEPIRRINLNPMSFAKGQSKKVIGQRRYGSLKSWWYSVRDKETP